MVMPRTFEVLIAGALAILISVESGPAMSPRPGKLSSATSFIVSYREKGIYTLSGDKQVDTLLYHLTYNLLNKGTLSVSPNDSLCAFIEVEPGVFASEESTRQGRYDKAPIPRLRIVDRTGRLCHTIEGVLRYAWSPTGDHIAYITYDMRDADYPYKHPTGLWVFNLSAGEAKKILNEASELYWAVHDQHLYINCWNMPTALRWNPSTGTLDTTEYNDIYFSPDGKYYLRLWKDESMPMQLFTTATNLMASAIRVYNILLPADSVIPENPTGLGGLPLGENGYPPYGWIFGRGHFLLFTKIDATVETEGEETIKIIKSQTIHSIKHSIYDPEKGKVIKQFEGAISSWVGDGSRLIVERNGKVEFKEKPE
jgi:hypothetical protein